MHCHRTILLPGIADRKDSVCTLESASSRTSAIAAAHALKFRNPRSDLSRQIFCDSSVEGSRSARQRTLSSRDEVRRQYQACSFRKRSLVTHLVNYRTHRRYWHLYVSRSSRRLLATGRLRSDDQPEQNRSCGRKRHSQHRPVLHPGLQPRFTHCSTGRRSGTLNHACHYPGSRASLHDTSSPKARRQNRLPKETSGPLIEGCGQRPCRGRWSRRTVACRTTRPSSVTRPCSTVPLSCRVGGPCNTQRASGGIPFIADRIRLDHCKCEGGGRRNGKGRIQREAIRQNTGSVAARALSS